MPWLAISDRASLIQVPTTNAMSGNIRHGHPHSNLYHQCHDWKYQTGLPSFRSLTSMPWLPISDRATLIQVPNINAMTGNIRQGHPHSDLYHQCHDWKYQTGPPSFRSLPSMPHDIQCIVSNRTITDKSSFQYFNKYLHEFDLKCVCQLEQKHHAIYL